jgi:hypothetical protein
MPQYEFCYLMSVELGKEDGEGDNDDEVDNDT